VTAPLWCVTRGAVAVSRGEVVTAPLQAAVWGLGRVAALELPQRWGGLVDLPATLDEGTAGRLATVLGGADGEDQVAVRASAVYGRRLGPAAPGDPTAGWHPDGTVLITGGTGALGGHVARGLARDGARHLMLLSRRGPGAPGADRLRDDLVALGARVTVLACDVTDRAQLESALAAVPADSPLTGVVHAAGTLDDGVLDALTSERFGTVFHAKVDAALLLDELTREMDLSAFVLFSSASSAIGNPGQANYAAANAVLDALAERRRAAGLAATSIAWGAWAGAGMAGGAAAEESSRRAGIAAMDPALAYRALLQAAGDGEPTAVVAAVASDQFVRSFTAARPSALLRDLPGYAELFGTTVDGSPSAPHRTALREELAALPEQQRLEPVLNLVRQRACAVLGYRDLDVVGPDRAFRDLGFDSLGIVELRNQLTAATGLDLPSTLVFDHPTPADLAEHIVGELVPAGPAAGDEETELRAALAALSLDQLRDLGVLDSVRQLTGRGPATAADPGSFDEMDLDDLVQAALGSPNEQSGE
jgi:NAD(P)-dependent dehydrogenase (short-subunit alcohol dehydrogenase family)/acyl carrier protein